MTISIVNKNIIHQIIYTLIVLTSLQSQTLMNFFIHLNINQPVQMETVNDMIIPFEGNINPGNPMGLRIDIQATKEIDKETEKIDISVSNDKYILF